MNLFNSDYFVSVKNNRCLPNSMKAKAFCTWKWKNKRIKSMTIVRIIGCFFSLWCVGKKLYENKWKKVFFCECEREWERASDSERERERERVCGRERMRENLLSSKITTLAINTIWIASFECRDWALWKTYYCFDLLVGLHHHQA